VNLDKFRESDGRRKKLAAEIQPLLPNVHPGTLQFWGIWFERPYDNYHVIQSAHADGDCLVLKFEQQEQLLVWHPRAAKISATEFSIFNASKVRWEWYYSTRPQTPGNVMVDEFDFNAATFSFQARSRSGRLGAASL
jgi:hypothetical protein